MADTKFTPGPYRNYAPEINKIVEEDYRTIAGGVEYLPKNTEGQGFAITGCIKKEDADLMTAAPNLY